MDRNACTLSGSPSASGATATVVGSDIIVTVPTGGSGKIDVTGISIGNTGTMKWRLGAGAYADASITTQRTFVSTDTLTFESTGLTSPEVDSCTLIDTDTGKTIATVTITRT